MRAQQHQPCSALLFSRPRTHGCWKQLRASWALAAHHPSIDTNPQVIAPSIERCAADVTVGKGGTHSRRCMCDRTSIEPSASSAWRVSVMRAEQPQARLMSSRSPDYS
jgi:hypothetical protein